jgi:hypothetical protein
MRALADHVARLLKWCWRSRNGRVARCHELTDQFATTAKPGDVLAVFGAGWVVSDFASCIERATREKGLRKTLLIYDIIPLRRAKERLANAFRIWFRHMLPLARAVLKVLDTTQGALNAEEPELRRRA